MSNCAKIRSSASWRDVAGREALDKPLAGESTLNRMELGTGINDRYKKITFWKNGVDELLVKVFVESHKEAPAEIVLDVETNESQHRMSHRFHLRSLSLRRAKGRRADAIVHTWMWPAPSGTPSP